MAAKAFSKSPGKYTAGVPHKPMSTGVPSTTSKYALAGPKDIHGNKTAATAKMGTSK